MIMKKMKLKLQTTEQINGQIIYKGDKSINYNQ